MHNSQFESIFTSASLYDVVFNLADHSLIRKFREEEYTIDAYCIRCGQIAVFHHKDSVPSRQGPDTVGDNVFVITGERGDKLPIGFFFQELCSCTRCRNASIICNFITTKAGLVKYGQIPSIADLSIHEILKYKKLLGSEYAEFSKAIGLVSHGVGVGSFVYLRRILENMVSTAITDSIAKGDLDQLTVNKMRFSEKIQAVKQSLPAFLSENPKIYAVISKGVHELTEKECLEYFPAVRGAIELILDQKIAELEKKEKEISVAKAIAKFE